MTNHLIIYKTLRSKPRIFLACFFVITAIIFGLSSIYVFNSKSADNTSPNSSSEPQVPASGSSESAKIPVENSINNVEPTPQPSTQSKPATLTPTIDTNSKEFVDHSLGITFKYAPQSGGALWQPKVTGNKVYMLNQNHPDQTTRYLEVINIDSATNINDALNKSVLKDYDKSSCPIKVSQTGNASNVSKATITYTEDNLPQGYFLPIDPAKCPADYTPINWIAYFYFNTQHPTKLIYFNIGQDNIPASLDPNLKGVGYDSTIKIL